MRADISWWSSFLPLFNGVSLIKASSCDFSDLHFATDASLTGGGAICLDECFRFQFPPDILTGASHISSLELYTIVVAVQFWAPKLRHRKFIVSCDNQAAVSRHQFWLHKGLFHAALLTTTVVFRCCL